MLDNFRAISVTWDHSTNTIYNNIRTASEDANGRKLVVQVVNGHQLEDLTIVDLRLYWEFDEHKGFDDFELIDEDNGIYEIHFSTDMVSHVGAHKAWLHLVDVEGTVTSEPFTVTVFEGVDADTIQDSNEFSALSNALVAISDLEANYAPRLNSVENNKADKATVNSEVSRLDQKDADLTAQLAQKVGNGKKAELEDLSATVLSAIEGGEDTSFDLLSIPQDKSVSVVKTDFINEGVNKLNLHDKDFIEGKFLNSVSSFTEDNGHFTSGFIPVKNGDVVRYTTSAGMGRNNMLHFYDIDKKNIGATPRAEYPYEYDYREETIDLEGVHYLRVSYANNMKVSAMVTINMTYPDNFVPYTNQLNQSFVFNENQKNFVLDSVLEVSDENPLFNKTVSFNGDSISAGSGYSGGYGKIIAEQNNMIYENISVSGGTLTAETFNSAGNERHWVSRTISNMREDSDYIILQGGVNDGSLSVPIGEVTTGYTEELDDTTFCGALESICKQVLERFPGKKIGYVFVHHMASSQKTYFPYIYDILEKWGIPYCDLYKEVPPLNYIPHLKQSHTSNGDGWHPNEKGYRDYYVPKIEAWMKTL